jgi:hypothetical protein
MNVIECVPLAGRGLVARRGGLVALSDGLDPGPDPLLAALAAVADSGGDGAALVLAGTRAALERGGRPAWACAGVTFGGEVAVLAHGDAAALVSVDGGPETEVTASGSMIPVARTLTGAVVTIRLVIGATAPADPRLWLDAGTVFGGGVMLTVAQEKSHRPVPNDPYAIPAPTVISPNVALPDPVPPKDMQPKDTLPKETVYPAGHEPTMLARISPRHAGAPAGGAQAFREPAAAEVTPFPDDPFADPAGPAGRIPAGPDAESWFRAEDQPSRPTTRMTQADGAGTDGPPEPPFADISTMKLEQLGVVEPVVVDGAMCARMHFNAPDAMFCRECRVSMREVPKNTRRQPRPPLGVLLVDDGRGYLLDRDYVIGREPLLDDDVAAGRAAPLPITDGEGSVSRLHLRVSLVGWRVEVRDLGSANGSVLYRAGGPRTLAPADAVVLDPGARVGVGRRNVQFLPYGVSPHSASPHSATPDGATA